MSYKGPESYGGYDESAIHPVDGVDKPGDDGTKVGKKDTSDSLKPSEHVDQIPPKIETPDTSHLVELAKKNEKANTENLPVSQRGPEAVAQANIEVENAVSLC